MTTLRRLGLRLLSLFRSGDTARGFRLVANSRMDFTLARMLAKYPRGR